MKRKLNSLLLLVLCVACLLSTVSAQGLAAAEDDTCTQRIDFEDGSYCIVGEVITCYTAADSEEKTGQKTSTYFNSDDEPIYSVIVYATFTYDGSSATATSAEAYVVVHDSSATYVSKSVSTSGNSATATGTVKYKSINRTLKSTLTCSKTGVLS